MQNKIRSFTNLLHSTTDLRHLIDKLGQLDQISNFINSNLEPDLAGQCRVANLRDGCLILSTSSPAWNHKLRFAKLDLLSALRANPAWSGLKSIEVRVDYIPLSSQYTHTNLKKPAPISKRNLQILQQTAENVKSSKLAKSLSRLASKLAQ